MKKILIFVSLLMMLTGVSCSGGNPTSVTSAPTAETVKLDLKETDITMSEDFKTILSLDKLGEKVLVFGTDTNSGYMGYVTDKSFLDYHKFVFTPKENEIVKSACLCKFGKTAVVTLLDNELMLYVFNSDGNVGNEYNLGEHEFDTEMGAIITANGEDYIINLNNESLLAVSADGTVQGEIDCKGGNILGFSKDNADVPVVILDYGDTTETAHINCTSLENKQKCSDIYSSAYAICGGNERYSLIADFNDGLYGLSGDTWVKLTDYMDNTFTVNDVCRLLCTGENEFVALTRDGGSSHLTMLSERDISELKSKKVITIATWTDIYISDDIKTFNNTNDDYRIEVKKYGGNTSLSEETLAPMREDILSGNPPDMLLNIKGSVTSESFGARESLFVDMYELIDNDPNLSREDFVDGYLEAMDFRGKLFSIAPSFTLNTLGVKDKYLNGLTEWTYEDMMNVVSTCPENMGIVPWSDSWKRSDFMLNMIDYCSFIDFEKAECYYDSPEFISIMELTQEHGLGMTLDEYNSFLNGEQEYDMSPQERYFIDDKYLINNYKPYLFSMSDIHSTVMGAFNEPMTFVGYPDYMGVGTKFTPDEHRNFSILKSCKYPEGAWKFIRDTYFTEDYYYGWNGLACFPALDKYLTEKTELEKTEQTVEDEETGEQVTAYSYYLGTDEDYVYYEPFTEDEAKKYSDFVREAAKHRMDYNSTIRDILSEELTAYFEGERSAEETAEVIQNRVSLYVSERYS